MPIPNTRTGPDHNLILAALPSKELEKLSGELEHVELATGEILWEAGEKGDYIYFPSTSVISLVYENDTGTSISVVTLGRSGIAGMYIMTGGIRMPDRAIALHGGEAYRMKARTVKSELADCGDFHALLLSYTNSLLVNISQNCICNRLHRIDQQLARWLVECRDKLQRDIFSMTHDQIAGVLGVRRESISLASAQLQKSGSIKTSRGKIEIVDEERLCKSSCECYVIVKTHIERTLAEYNKGHAD